MIPSPKMNRDRTARRRGACPECGKNVVLRNSDGMISKHGTCIGEGKLPSYAARSEFDSGWVPPRRSE